MTTQERTEWMEKHGAQIAKHMTGWSWDYSNEDGRYRSNLKHDKTGATIYLYLDTYRKKLEASVSYPDSMRGSHASGELHKLWKESKHSCGMSPEKDAKKQASDITRKLAGLAQEVHQLDADSTKAFEQRNNSKQAMAQGIAALIPGSRVYNERDRVSEPSVDRMPGEMYGDFKPHCDGEFTIELRSVPGELAQAIAQAIGTHYA